MIRLSAIVIAALLMAAPVFAQPRVVSQAEASEVMKLQVGETKLLQLSEKIIRIAVADPGIADVQVVTEEQVLITAKSVGMTNVTMWNASNKPLVVSLGIARNLDQLRGQLDKLFPGERITVGSVGDLVILSGTVSDVRVPTRAAELASLYSEKVANQIEVSGDQQVELEVRFAEVSRTGLRKIGMNFLWQDNARGYVGGQATPSTTTGSYLAGNNNLTIPGTGAGGPPLVSAPSAAQAFNLFFSTGLSKFPFSTVLSILSQEGLAKILAEPTLVALSGQEASFHAGGEVPILIARQLGEVSVEYKKFGVRLKFTPTVLGRRVINTKLMVEVSEPDPTSGATLGGFSIPGFRTRSSDTTVRIEDGESFAIAGLLSDSVRSTVQKIPILGSIPVLGMLFRSSAFQREETELMVVVRARLVRPLGGDEKIALPGEDELNDPTDWELFVLGDISPKKASRPKRPARGTASSYGPSGPIGFVRVP
ncbi:MAG: type II and III secretion system protein family protein [Myxococcales bacterium]|nr:type II and III secretion system protein family protein [Myxococcales bacterium]